MASSSRRSGVYNLDAARGDKNDVKLYEPLDELYEEPVIRRNSSDYQVPGSNNEEGLYNDLNSFYQTNEYSNPLSGSIISSKSIPYASTENYNKHCNDYDKNIRMENRRDKYNPIQYDTILIPHIKGLCMNLPFEEMEKCKEGNENYYKCPPLPSQQTAGKSKLYKRKKTKKIIRRKRKTMKRKKKSKTRKIYYRKRK